MNIVVKPGRKLEVLQRFVRKLLYGQYYGAQYYGAFASVGADARVSNYVIEIFMQFSIMEAVVVLIDILGQLSSTHSELSWKCTVEAAIILRMLEGPFNLVPAGTKPSFAFHTLPDECDALEEAKHRIEGTIKQYNKPTLLYVSSANARFPEVEGFMVYTSGILFIVISVGFQMNSADLKPLQQFGPRTYQWWSCPNKRSRSCKESSSAESWMKIHDRGFLGHEEWLRDHETDTG